jgi:putative tryptophan/tyrosine transport system substrate-binding protein
MRRRDALLLLCSAALPLDVPVMAQTSGPVQRIGWVGRGSSWDWSEVAVLLRPLGWTRGGNLRADVRVAVTPAELPTIAREVVEARPHLIVTNGTPATVAVLAETQSIPVIFFGIADPIGNGVVDNLARPGRNVTGFTSYEPSLAGKWLELLKEVDPRIRRAAMLFNPETSPNRSAPFVDGFRAAAASLAIEPIIAFAQNPSEIETVIIALASDSGGALLILPDEFTASYRNEIVVQSWRHRVPTIFGDHYAVATGGLLSYGPRLEDLYQSIASYIDRVLRGTKAGELPVQSPTRHELALNVRVAKMIGLEIPQALLARADTVVD